MTRPLRSAGVGKGGTTFYAAAGGRMAGDPEHVRDVALLQRAHAKLDEQRRARFAAGNTDLARATSRIDTIVRSLLSLMASRPWATLTENQRAMCLKILGLTELPPVKEAELPEVLRVLPKKPPGRGG